MAETILITGATGLIGSALCRHFKSRGMNVLQARRCVSEFRGSRERIDYIVHCAAMTSSKAFVERPVETIDSVVWLTRDVLELAHERSVKSMVYLSSMEVLVNTDQLQVRSSYPESKRLAENLCVAYNSEYGVPVKIVRLTQTFGEGVRYDDGRVFAQFARAIIERKNIVLNTRGETERSYLYVGDAVTAIETVLVHGENARAYVATNEETYCSIREMAERVIAANPNSGCRLVFNLVKDSCYLPSIKLRLDSSPLRALGWHPMVGLEEMFARLIRDMRTKRTDA